jgi:hypothetical protein
MITPRAVVGLIVGALGMPIGMCVLFALSRLLDAMKDESGALGLERASLVLFALWLIDLVALVIVTAVNSLQNPPPGSKDEAPKAGDE